MLQAQVGDAFYGVNYIYNSAKKKRSIYQNSIKSILPN